MKNKFTKRKIRYAASSAAVTALIIAAIIVFNVIFTALATKFLWYVDMTPELLFTLSDECFDLIENGDSDFENSTSPIEKVKEIRAANKEYNSQNGLTPDSPDYRDENIMINIIFCDEIDAVEENLQLHYIYKNALELEVRFGEYIDVKNYNTVRNPSSVSQYMQQTNYIYTTDVIIEFGTEYRVVPCSSFYKTDDGEDAPWAYDGEKKLAASILAVTRAESPIACITVNHDELSGDTAAFAELFSVLETAGYIVQPIDLMNEDFPEDCRLAVVCNPRSDFLVADGVSEVDEIKKLSDFLDNSNSLMVFMGPTDQKLKHFEEFLDEWGIVFDRYQDASGNLFSKQIEDKDQAITFTDGSYSTFISRYVTQGKGGELMNSLLDTASPPKVIFKNATPISMSSSYTMSHVTNTETGAYFDYGEYVSSGVSRQMYNVFVSGEGAVARANGEIVAKATPTEPFSLMTVTTEKKSISESNYSSISEYSYVIACGSVDFLSTALMQSSSYGNCDVLLSIGRTIGKEPVPVGLDLKPLGDRTIDVITASEATQYTVVLSVVPVVVALVAGIFVIVRRKNR